MDTFWFWAMAAAMAVLIAAFLLRGLMRGSVEATPAAAQDMQVYRDQLAEADRDLARGTLTESEAARVKTEIARRLLEADRTAQAEAPAKATALPLPAMALVVAALAGALALYAWMGVPWYPDMPINDRLAAADAAMASRPLQAQAEANMPDQPEPQIDDEFRKLITKLRAAIDPASSTDLRGLALLAQNEAALGQFGAARAAQARLVAVKGDDASADDYAILAEMTILAAGGYVSPEAEQALIQTLKRDPKNGMARYFSGLMFAQGGRFDRAYVLWKPLLDESPADARWMPPLLGQIEDVAVRAGIPFRLPESVGPSAGDMAAAADMAPDERQQMIEGMVAQLQGRLTTEGGDAAEWARLIKALMVLNRKEDAQAAYDLAKAALSADPAALTELDAAAAAAGLAP